MSLHGLLRRVWSCWLCVQTFVRLLLSVRFPSLAPGAGVSGYSSSIASTILGSPRYHDRVDQLAGRHR